MLSRLAKRLAFAFFCLLPFACFLLLLQKQKKAKENKRQKQVKTFTDQIRTFGFLLISQYKVRFLQ
jgi:hypothetical protein